MALSNYAVRADAKSQHALDPDSDTLSWLDEAMGDAKSADRYLPNNPFVLGAAIDVCLYTMQYERWKNGDKLQRPTRAERFAEKIAEQIDDWPHHLELRMRRLLFYRLMGREMEFNKEYASLSERGMGWPVPDLAKLLVAGDKRGLRNLIKPGSSPYPQVVLAIQHAINRDARWERELKSIEKIHDSIDVRAFSLDIPSAAQDAEKARRAAKGALADMPAKHSATIWRVQLWATQYRAGDLEEAEFLRRTDRFHFERSFAHFTIGMKKLTEKGDRDEVVRHLKIASDCVAPGWWATCMSRAYLDLINQGKFSFASDKKNDVLPAKAPSP